MHEARTAAAFAFDTTKQQRHPTPHLQAFTAASSALAATAGSDVPDLPPAN
jgi:hypothetical protein